MSKEFTMLSFVKIFQKCLILNISEKATKGFFQLGFSAKNH